MRRFEGSKSIDEAEKCIVDYEQNTFSSFSTVKSKKFEIPGPAELATKKIYWEERSSKQLPIPFTGVPFIVLGRQVRECCHGPDRHRSEKLKAKKLETLNKNADHGYYRNTKHSCRFPLQVSKKLNCPASVQLRLILVFPAYRIESNSSWAKKKQAKLLREDLLSPEKEVVGTLNVLVALPAPDSHKNHLTNEFAEQFLAGQLGQDIPTESIPNERRQIQLDLLCYGISKEEAFCLEKIEKIGGQERSSRKRHRKDGRKSSIYIYEKQRKVSRTKCACCQKNNGRPYWVCKECMGSYHPTCMGFDAEDDLESYICPKCVIKRINKAPPTFSEVEAVLYEHLRESQVDQSSCEGLSRDKNETPVYLKHPRVQFFYDVQWKKGKKYSVINTSFGPFVLLPQVDFGNYISFSDKLNTEELVLFDIPLKYFLNSYDKKFEIVYYSENVVKLLPTEVKHQYEEWLEQSLENL